MRRLVLVCVALTGCDRVFGIDPARLDAPAGDAAGDGGHDATPPLGPFSSPVLVSISPLMIPVGGFISDPCLIDDESQLGFTLYPASGAHSDILVATATADPTMWTAPLQGDFDQVTRDETNPKLARDGVEIWLAANAGTGFDIEAWTRSAPTAAQWTNVTATEANGLESANDDRPGTPTLDLDHMILHRGPPANVHLVEYERAAPGAAWTPVPGTLDAVNLFQSTTNGHLSGDGLQLVFAAGPGGGNADLYITTRPALGAPFDTPVRIDEVSTPTADDGDPWLSEDGLRLWFSRSFGSDPIATWGIYYASRGPL